MTDIKQFAVYIAIMAGLGMVTGLLSGIATGAGYPVSGADISAWLALAMVVEGKMK